MEYDHLAMTSDGDSAALAAFVHERRVRFTVAAEQVIGRDGPIPVGFDVRLLAWHGHEAHALESCPVCLSLEEHLRQVAEFSVGTGEKPAEIEIDPDYAALYDSHDAPGTDDVALDLRLLRRGNDDRPVGAVEQRYLKEITARLKALGAPQR
jgi:hypothetical protein